MEPSLSPRRRALKKTMFIGAGLAVIVVLLGVTTYFSVNNPKNSAPARPIATSLTRSTACKSDLIDRANVAIRDNDIATLSEIESEVTKLPDYRGDINCSYIRVRQALMTGNIAKTEAALDDLRWAHGEGGLYSSRFDPAALEPRELEATLEAMKVQQAQQREYNKKMNIPEGN